MSYTIALPGQPEARIDIVDGTSTGVQRCLRRAGLAGCEPSTTAALLALFELQEPGFSFYDVGADVGLHSVICATLFAPSTVIGFEPMPDAARIAREIVSANGLDVIIEELELGAENTHTARFPAAVPDSPNGFVDGLDTNVEPVTIDVETVDSYVERTGCVPHVMKLGTSTSAPQVVFGARETLRDHRPSLIVQVPHREGDDHGIEIMEAMEEFGYRYYDIAPDGTFAPADTISGNPAGEERNWLLSGEPLPVDFGERFERWQLALGACTPDRNARPATPARGSGAPLRAVRGGGRRARRVGGRVARGMNRGSRRLRRGVRARFAVVLGRIGVLEATLRVRDGIRAVRSGARARVWKQRLGRSGDRGDETRYEVIRERASVWSCELRTSVDPIEMFVEAFEHCLVGSEELALSEFGILEREGGAYPAIEMSERAWESLVRRWHRGDAPRHLHVQRPSHRSRPECVRAASQRTATAIAGWTGRVVVFVAVAHPSSPFPVGRRLGVDVYVRAEIDERRVQRPWGASSQIDWVRRLRQPPFPIDAVYTWVDDADPEWVERRAAAKSVGATPAGVSDSASAHRFANRDELRYSLRSVALYAEWFDSVRVVTDRQRPSWAAPSLNVVDHRDILPDDALPTFNSHAIETGLHRVPDLNEHYVYLNDDVFFDAPARWSLFFTEDGRSRFFLSKATIPEVGAEVTTIDHATSNGRSLVQRQFGTIVSQKMKHTPHAQRRSIHEWMETTFGPEHRSTARTRFRSTDDQSFASFLHHYVGVELDMSEAGHDLRYDYFNAADERVATRLRALRDRPGLFTTYCINDGDVAEEYRRRVDAIIHDHLVASLPYPTSWEST